MSERLRPIINALTVRLSSRYDLHFEQVVNEQDKFEDTEIIIAPTVPTYDPERLQAILFELTDGITSDKPRIAAGPAMIGLGFRHGMAQYAEPEVEGQKARTITIRVVPSMSLAAVIADYRSHSVLDIIPHIPTLAELGLHISPEILERFRGKENEMIEWAREQIQKVLHTKKEWKF